jgi:nucleoside-diphosphate-sugar epimerase
MVIVILGYKGLIGNNILENLIKNKSFNLICVGRSIKNKPYISSNIKYYRWDFNTFKKSNLTFLKKANIIINCVGKTESNLHDIKNVNFIFIKKLVEYINSHKLRVRFVHLGSVAVYGGNKNYFGQYKIISENSKIKANDLYSNSKLKGDLLIQNVVKKNLNKNFSFTILRVSNVFGGLKKSNLFKFVLFSLKYRFWIKCFDNIVFNFIHVNDVTQAVNLIISKLKVSKNKIFIVSDDCNQNQVYENYKNFHKKKIINIRVSKNIIKSLIYFLPKSSKIRNFFSLISTRVSYSNKKIKKELNFKPEFSLHQKIKFFK